MAGPFLTQSEQISKLRYLHTKATPMNAKKVMSNRTEVRNEIVRAEAHMCINWNNNISVQLQCQIYVTSACVPCFVDLIKILPRIMTLS
jgi:hypothetical protein